MVGTAARMRVSSVILRSLSRGTLRSQRTNTVLPSRSAFLRSPTDFFLASTLSAARAWARTEVFLALTEDLAKNAREERAGAAAKAAIVVVFGVVEVKWCGLMCVFGPGRVWAKRLG